MLRVIAPTGLPKAEPRVSLGGACRCRSACRGRYQDRRQARILRQAFGGTLTIRTTAAKLHESC